jgi:signal transduction histidine kinase
MTNLMDDLLLYGRISGGKLNPDFTEVDLVQLANWLIDQELGSTSDSHKVKLIVSGEARTIQSDTKLLSHALENLLTNALKYSPDDQPELKISFSADRVQIRVRDKGIGIAEKDLGNLFQPFYRGANATEMQGTGLGLSIAKEYIELLEGSIELKSKLDEGTEVIVNLPIRQSAN